MKIPDLNTYDVAQVCSEGHVTNPTTEDLPQFNKEHCEQCGEKTLTACPKCGGPIRGAYRGGFSSRYKPPSFCHKCGTAFPWTEKKAQAAIELFIDATGASGDEAKQFEESVQQITKDTAAAQVASGRIKRALTKVGEGVRDAIIKLVVDIASESVKKSITGG